MWTDGFYKNMNTYILTESKNFRTFLKENYSIVLDSCKLHIYKKENAEHVFNHNVGSSYAVCTY